MRLDDAALKDKVDLPYLILGPVQVHGFVGSLSHAVSLLDVEPNTADIGRGLRLLSDGVMQAAIHSPAAPLRINIDALDPPELGISPIAPFIRDQTLSDHHQRRPMFRDIEHASLGLIEDSQGSLP